MRRTAATVAGWLAGVGTATLLAAVTLGQIDDFETGLDNWMAGPRSPDAPVVVPDGGPQGAGDAYLEKIGTGTTAMTGALELVNQSQWTGDYLDAGVTKIAARMASFGTGDPDPSDDPELHIRLVVQSLELGARYWSTDAAVLPPDGDWRWVVFDLLDMVPAVPEPMPSGEWLGPTLDQVLMDVDRLWIVSDEGTVDGEDLYWPPDPVAGTLGIDDLLAEGFSVTDKGTQPGLDQPLQTPGSCANCHRKGDDDHVEPWNTWAGSMMAQAARDPIFWAALDVANNDFAGAGDFCLRCHAPAAWLNRRSEPLIDGCGLEGEIDDTGQDFDGVTCHLCHRMMVNEPPPPGEDDVYFENAQYWIDDSDCDGEGEPCRRGPYDYSGGEFEPPHAWAFSQYHVDSDNCGNCHNVTNPVKELVDEKGDVTGIPFPIERTFKEWEQSDYPAGGESCQSCHMPQAEDEAMDGTFACVFELNDRTDDLPIHEFAGGNAWIPEVLRMEYPSLSLDTELAATRDAALDMLQNRSAVVEIESIGDAIAGESLDVDVKVTNLTGHKLPTGYPEGRRMWIHVEARDGGDTVFWESGAYDPFTAVLTRDPQAKVYETKQGIWDYNGTGACDTVDGEGDEIFHFILNDCIELDNRIPPLGFTGGDDPETQPVGYVYPETSPGSGVLVNYDVTSYAIPLPEDVLGPVSVTVTLRYQTASKEYVEFLLAESDENAFPPDCIERQGSPGPQTQTRAEILYDMWQIYDKSPPVDMGAAAEPAEVCYPLIPGHTGEGADPVAAPGSSTGCPAGSYVPGEEITLTAAPAEGWVVAGWSGTDDDGSTEETNTVTMPAEARPVSVAYEIPLTLSLSEPVEVERLFLACQSISTLPGFVVVAPDGAARLRAGERVVFGERPDGPVVEEGAALTVELDPDLCSPTASR